MNGLGGASRSKRNRLNSINDDTSFSSNLSRTSQLPMNAFLGLGAASENDNQQDEYRVEAKRRGMSDVDDTNFKQL